MQSKKTSAATIGKLFESVTPEQKLTFNQAKLREYEHLLDDKPENEVIKNQLIELNYACSKLCLEKKDLVAAKQFLVAADKLAGSEHHLKFNISTLLLTVEEDIFLSKSTSPKRG
jgi:hypothetical protein